MKFGSRIEPAELDLGDFRFIPGVLAASEKLRQLSALTSAPRAWMVRVTTISLDE
jgi:hypothetical protein